MPEITRLLAVDLGASSGRVILGIFDGVSVSTEEIRRFDNRPVQAGETLYWNVLHLFDEIKQGIRQAAARYGRLDGISVDTWGVDYGLIDGAGRLAGLPRHYRDGRMAKHREALETVLPLHEQFALTGNQPALINTVYQLFADLREGEAAAEAGANAPGSPLLLSGVRLLMMPDLFHWLLSGRARGETTILSTGGLLAVSGRVPSTAVLNRLGIPASLLQEQVQAGTVIGGLAPGLCKELETAPFPVIAGASHDTAAAVASVPYRDKRTAAFISCGTWSIVGIETQAPVLSEQAFAAGLTNESCYGGGNRLLKNITGLWLLQECRRVWNENGETAGYAELTALAEAAGPAQAFLDPDDPVFASPGDMPERIRRYCRDTGQPVPEGTGPTVRVILESLARAYAKAIRLLEETSGAEIAAIHMVGGGIRNRLLCRLTAAAAGREVIAGPAEASALGNILVQLAALGRLDADGMAAAAAASALPERYAPDDGL